MRAAMICLRCDWTRPGTLPASHGLCGPCLRITDPEAWADLYGPIDVDPEALRRVGLPVPDARLLRRPTPA